MQKLKTAALALCLAAVTSQAGISYSPVTTGATGSAQKLYNFLAVNYGVKTVSGVMTGDVGSGTDIKSQVDVDTMYQKTGKYPALVGFDFLFATGVKESDSWYQAYTNTAITLAEDLWNKGGIPAFTWHWKDPGDSVDAFYATQAAAGKGKDFTTFNFTKGFTDPGCTANCTWNTSSVIYQQLVSDIDTIAAKFLILQKDSIAAIFRPVHEASGAWFWWGTHGGAAYQALYNLIYDRMVNADGVKNLVWVWNPEYATDASWNPGSTKYDVISMDIYEAYDYTTKFVTGYKALTTNFGSENKIFAVSENGPIPDISTMKTSNTVWSWWMPWYQSWSGKFLDQTVDAVWKANMNDSCTITLDEMPGWSSYTVSSTPVASCTVGYELGKLDTARPVSAVVFPGDTATNGYLMVSLDYTKATTQDTAAKGNIIVDATGSLDFTGIASISFNVKNSNTYAGIWFTLAFLGNANTGWTWAQPDGCWINAGDSTTCTIDLTTTAGTSVPGKISLDSLFKNISKVYIEIFANGYTGTIFFDDIVANTGKTLVSFDSLKTLSAEQTDGVISYGIVGHGNYKMGISSKATIASGKLMLNGNALELTTAKSGNVSVELYGTDGARVVTLFNGNMSAGTHSLSLSKVRSGYYIARVKGVNGMAAKPIFVK